MFKCLAILVFNSGLFLMFSLFQYTHKLTSTYTICIVWSHLMQTLSITCDVKNISITNGTQFHFNIKTHLEPRTLQGGRKSLDKNFKVVVSQKF